MKNVVKVLGVIALVAVIGFGFVSCGGDDGGDGGKTVKVTGVTLNKTYLILAVGDSEKLIATVAPDNATNKAVTWSLRDNLNPIVSVSADGTVTALSEGVTNIFVHTEDGGFSERCTVDVRAAVNANIDIDISDLSYGTSTIYGRPPVWYSVEISLELPSGSNWTLPDNDAQILAAVKSWVTTGGTTTPALTDSSWDFGYQKEGRVHFFYTGMLILMV